MDLDRDQIDDVEKEDYLSDYDEEKDAKEEDLELVVDEATGKAYYRKRLPAASKWVLYAIEAHDILVIGQWFLGFDWVKRYLVINK